MSDEFEVGDFEDGVPEEAGNVSLVAEDSNSAPRVAVSKFGMCPRSMTEHIPCLDNEDAIRKLESTERGERFERHCPEEGKRFNCLIPPPKGYRPSIPWPRSRDEVTASFLSVFGLSLAKLFLIKIDFEVTFKTQLY